MKVVTIILGVLLLVGGIYCVFTPVATYAAIAWLIGLSMVVEGVASIITWSEARRLGLANGWTLAGSIISLVLGVFLLGSYFLRFAVDMFIAYLIAIWLIVAGVTRIVAAIDSEAKHIDDIIEETELPAGTVLSQLTLLEIKGFVRHGPGQRFSLNIRKK